MEGILRSNGSTELFQFTLWCTVLYLHFDDNSVHGCFFNQPKHDICIFSRSLQKDLSQLSWRPAVLVKLSCKCGYESKNNQFSRFLCSHSKLEHTLVGGLEKSNQTCYIYMRALNETFNPLDGLPQREVIIYLDKDSHSFGKPSSALKWKMS